MLGQRFSSITFSRGVGTYKPNGDVQLRGVTLKGRFNDLPNMIFLPETFDLVENWIPFFTSPENKVPLTTTLDPRLSQHSHCVPAQLW
jgi:hypothetical protein